MNFKAAGAACAPVELDFFGEPIVKAGAPKPPAKPAGGGMSKPAGGAKPAASSNGGGSKPAGAHMTMAEQLQAQMLKNKKVGTTKVKENPDLPKKEMTIAE